MFPSLLIFTNFLKPKKHQHVKTVWLPESLYLNISQLSLVSFFQPEDISHAIPSPKPRHGQERRNHGSLMNKMVRGVWLQLLIRVYLHKLVSCKASGVGKLTISRWWMTIVLWKMVNISSFPCFFFEVSLPDGSKKGKKLRIPFLGPSRWTARQWRNDLPTTQLQHCLSGGLLLL